MLVFTNFIVHWLTMSKSRARSDRIFFYLKFSKLRSLFARAIVFWLLSTNLCRKLDGSPQASGNCSTGARDKRAPGSNLSVCSGCIAGWMRRGIDPAARQVNSEAGMPAQRRLRHGGRISGIALVVRFFSDARFSL